MRKVCNGSVKWPLQHLERFDEKGLRWWDEHGPDEIDMLLFPGLQVLSQRALEVLTMRGVREFPEATTRITDASQSSSRQGLQTEYTNTITPHGTPRNCFGKAVSRGWRLRQESIEKPVLVTPTQRM